MIGMDIVKETVLNTLFTGRLKNGWLVSLILLATPESGKTSIVNSFNAKNIGIFTDLTGKGLLDALESHSEMSHIVLNDLTVTSAHSKKTSAYFFAILGAATEEGIKSIGDPSGNTNYNLRRGAIVCTTIEFIADKRRLWITNGLSSRFLPFCYRHSEALQAKVLRSIKPQNSDGEIHIPEIRVPDSLINVTISDNMIFECERMALIMAGQNKEMGYRRKKQFMSLVMARALRREWKNPKVQDKDIQWLSSIQEFLSWSKPHEI